MLLRLPTEQWPYFHVLARLGLALFVGLMAGMERERRAKEAGPRTFAFASMLGCLGGCWARLTPWRRWACSPPWWC